MLNCNGPLKDVFIKLNLWNSDDHDLIITDLGDKKQAELKHDLIEPYGKDGFDKVDEEAFRGFTRSSEIVFLDKASYDLFVDTFFIGQYVIVEYSDDGGKFREGVISDINDEIVYKETRKVKISITLQPFKKTVGDPIEVTGAIVLNNIGNATALPIMTLEGTGTGSIIINGEVMELEAENGLIIDNKEIDIFHADGTRANSKRISGGFFRLKSGNNNISITGGITKMTIEIEWRWR